MRTDHICDKDYVECLAPIYQRNYFSWKQRMLCRIDDFVSEAKVIGFEEAVKKFAFTPKDIRLIRDLRFLTDEECEAFGLVREI